MLALVQRVTRARVEVGRRVVGQIERGLLVLVCAEPADTEALADKLVAKLLKLRIFADAAGKMNLSLVDVKGGLLVVSQFTLAADVSGDRCDPENDERDRKNACRRAACRRSS